MKDFFVPSVEADASPRESSMASEARRYVAPPMEQKSECKINGYELLLTCSACPEQYDVLKDGERIGYLRLRHGYFRADYPVCGGETVYEAEPDGDGEFFNFERGHYLTEAVAALNARLHRAELSEEGDEFYSYSNRFEQDGPATASSVSDEHTSCEDPKGLSGEAMPARSAQAETPFHTSPLNKGAVEEMVERLAIHAEFASVLGKEAMRDAASLLLSLSSNLEETQKENERLERIIAARDAQLTEEIALTQKFCGQYVEARSQLSLLQKRLEEVEANLQRTTDHLAAWAADHADEATTETWAALHCARSTLSHKGESK